MAKTTLCVYCSRSGHTRTIMEDIAKQLGAEAVEITDGKDRSGIIGYIGAAISALGSKFPPIVPFRTEKDLSEYERIIVGFPIWAETACPIAKTFLMENGAKLKGELYFVATHMSNLTYDKPLAQMDILAGKKSSGNLSLQTKNHDPAPEIRGFLAGMK